MPVFLIFALLIGVLAVGFALVNNDPVTVQLLVGEYQASLALVLLSTFALGAVVGLLACLPTLIRAKLTIHDLKRKLPSPKEPTDPNPG
ncbi:lipopolysaccharide assembly LapA domain-containing protein, partial [Elusimicrobiota bacterium]